MIGCRADQDVDVGGIKDLSKVGDCLRSLLTFVLQRGNGCSETLRVNITDVADFNVWLGSKRFGERQATIHSHDPNRDLAGAIGRFDRLGLGRGRVGTLFVCQRRLGGIGQQRDCTERGCLQKLTFALPGHDSPFSEV